MLYYGVGSAWGSTIDVVFVLRRRTVDAVFVLRRLSEKFRAKNKNLFFIFVDLENTFDRVPREIIRFALRRRVVPEYLVNGVTSLYKGCETAVSVDGELSSSFSVKVGVHQGSALSPLLFIMVIDVLTEDVRDGSLMELLYADDLVLGSSRCFNVSRQVGLISCRNVFVYRTCLGHNCSVEVKLEFKRGEDVLEEVQELAVRGRSSGS